MKKLFLFLFLILGIIIALPLSNVEAVVQSLNSQTGQNQTFANDTNIQINSAGNVHTLNWSGLLGVSRGGTGLTSVPDGAFLFGNGNSPFGATYSPSFSFLNATNTNATSTFAGNFSVAGNVQLTGLADGILSTFNGLLSTIGIQAPLVFSNNTLSISAAGSDGQVQFNDGGDLEGSAKFTFEYNPKPILTLAGSGGAFTFQGVADGDSSGLEFFGGDASAAGSGGGGFRFYGGTGNGTGGGGVFEILGGNGGSTSGDGGSFSVTAGSAQGGNSDGGDLIFTVGGWSGTGRVGEVFITAASSATTTVNIGEIGDVTSHSCFNTKNTDGDDVSFYFVGTSMIIENDICK